MVRTQEQQVLELARKAGVLRARDLAARDLPRGVLTRLVGRGDLVRVARGLYTLADAEVTEHHSLAEAARRVPSAVVCLVSALRFHGITTQAPHEVWLAIERGTSGTPAVRDLPLRFVTFSRPAFRHGVETHWVEGVRVRVTSAAKTVADCFKFRNKIGLDVAIEALREYRSKRTGTLDALYEAAEACRVRAVIQPYVEAIA
jgi:predicted transcriptional regulator of viral defense system